MIKKLLSLFKRKPEQPQPVVIMKDGIFQGIVAPVDWDREDIAKRLNVEMNRQLQREINEMTK